MPTEGSRSDLSTSDRSPPDRLRALFELPAHNPSFASVRAALDAGLAASTPSGRAGLDIPQLVPDERAEVIAPASEAPLPLLDFCVPVNRHFPLDELLAELTPRLPTLLRHYPDYAAAHQEALATLADLDPAFLVPANGSTELITLLCQSLDGPVATCVPTFGRWTDLPAELGVPVSFIQRREADDFALTVDDVVAHVRRQGARTLVLSNPSNPTGALMSTTELEILVERLADLDLIIIDESFLDFAGAPSFASRAVTRSNVVVVKSLGKSIGWHGLRLGYGAAHADLAARLRRRLPYWNINGVAAFVLRQVAARRDLLAHSFAAVREDRAHLATGLATLPTLRVFPSAANFIYARVLAPISGPALRERLLTRHSLLIRECGNKLGASGQYLRLAVNPEVETRRLIDALHVELAGDALAD